MAGSPCHPIMAPPPPLLSELRHRKSQLLIGICADTPRRSSAASRENENRNHTHSPLLSSLLPISACGRAIEMEIDRVWEIIAQINNRDEWHFENYRTTAAWIALMIFFHFAAHTETVTRDRHCSTVIICSPGAAAMQPSS